MSLNTVQEIEHAIRALTPSELEDLYAWLDRYCPQPIDTQLKADLEAGRIVDRIVQGAFERAANFVRDARPLSEAELQHWILDEFRAAGVTTAEPPIAAVQPNNGSPHYEPKPGASSPIRAGDLLLLDVWAKMSRPGSVYYDVTWMGYLGSRVPDTYARIFRIVREARG